MILRAKPAGPIGVLRQQVRNPVQDATPQGGRPGVVDDFDVEVRNKNLDRTCLVDELSGGQFVLVPLSA